MAGDSKSSQSSGITRGSLYEFVDHQETSNLELAEKEVMSSEWTDEKHNMYLKSIENSFLQQLYSYVESSGLHSHKKHNSYMRSSKQNESHKADQRIKFGRGEPPPQIVGNSCTSLQQPWIQHFRSRDDLPIQGSVSYVDEPMSFNQRAIYTCASTNISDSLHVYQNFGDPSIGEEFSGQNFDDEESSCPLHATKRMKTVEAMAANNE